MEWQLFTLLTYSVVGVSWNWTKHTDPGGERSFVEVIAGMLLELVRYFLITL